MASRNLSEAEAILRIDAQPPQAAKIAQADVVIENDGSLDELCGEVERAWQMLRNSLTKDVTRKRERRVRDSGLQGYNRAKCA